ncbi:MAG: CpsD/CapB family tyrosine-protein kinase, partial [Caldilineaceae bacterium]
LTLGTVPDSVIEEGTSPLTIVNEPHTQAAEAFRVLRTNLLFASVDRPLNVLQVTSATVEEGKSYISANLAAAFALTGKRVILIDADLRKPTQHRIFGLVNNLGVTTALVGGIDAIEEVMQPTRIPSLHVISSGPLPPNPAELISSLRMRDFLAAVRPLCDLVIVDSPPVTLVSDSAMLATQTDGVLVVFSAPTVRRDLARNTVGALRQVKAPILGIALNRAVSEKLGYYYTHSDTYGSHYYQGAYRHTPPSMVAPPVTVAANGVHMANGTAHVVQPHAAGGNGAVANGAVANGAAVHGGGSNGRNGRQGGHGVRFPLCGGGQAREGAKAEGAALAAMPAAPESEAQSPEATDLTRPDQGTQNRAEQTPGAEETQS